MPNKQIVRLSKLFLWPEPARFQAYPEFLVLIDPEEPYKHMHDVARRAGGQRMLDDTHVKHENIVRNLPGLEYNKEHEPVIRGVGLMQKTGKQFFLSDWGRQLRDAYLEDSTGIAWKVILASNLLSREPRIRSMVRIISRSDGVLKFPQGGFFTGRYKQAELIMGDKVYRPFVDQQECQQNLQQLIIDLGYWALGSWQQEIAEGKIIYSGADKESITATGLSMAMKAAFTLFKHLDLVDEYDGELQWRNVTAAQLLGDELAQDFGWDKGIILDTLRIVKDLIGQLTADNGFLVASQLINRMEERGIAESEKTLAKLLDAGHIRLEAWDYGQMRHGRGLFGEPDKQLLKLSIYGGERT